MIHNISADIKKKKTRKALVILAQVKLYLDFSSLKINPNRSIIAKTEFPIGISMEFDIKFEIQVDIYGTITGTLICLS